MRLAAIIVAGSLWCGCGGNSPAMPPTTTPTTWTVVLEHAVVKSTVAAPQLYVIAVLAGQTFGSTTVDTTTDSEGYYAEWDTPFFAADQLDIQQGITLQVWSNVESGSQLEGDTVFKPTLGEFGAGAISLGNFNDVVDLTVELTPN